MNLHGIAGPVVSAINPQIPVTALIATGVSAPGPDGTTVPIYADPLALVGQVQPITWRDLQQMEGVNLGGIRWKVYLYGEVDSVVRFEKKGGDLILIQTGRHQGTWLVAQILEQFPDWCCAAITFQSTQIPAGASNIIPNPGA